MLRPANEPQTTNETQATNEQKVKNELQAMNELKAMIWVLSRNVHTQLTPDEIHLAYEQFREKMKTPDPENPNLWTLHIGSHKLWGILDEGAGPNGEEVFTILFPEDY